MSEFSPVPCGPFPVIYNGHMGDELGKAFSALWWGVTIAWAGLIFYLSSHTYGPSFTQRLVALALYLVHVRLSPHALFRLDAVLRKLAHVTEYGIFALLLYGLPVGPRQYLWRPRRAALCVLAAAAYSLTDEFHQLFVPGRHASLLDCGLDTFGAAFAMLALVRIHRSRDKGQGHGAASSSDPTDSELQVTSHK